VAVAPYAYDMLNWRPYHHRSARRLFLLLSIGVGVMAIAIDLAFSRGVDRSVLAPSVDITLTVVPFLVVAAFLLAAQLVPRWRGPRSLVIQTEAGRPAFAAVRSFAILSFIAILVYWMLKFLERALAGRDAGGVPGALWFLVIVNIAFCLSICLALWQNTARRVVLTGTGLIVRRGLRTRSIAWEQVAQGGPKTPSHDSVAIMLWVTGPDGGAPEPYSLQDKHLSVSPALLAHAIRIYVKDPARRSLIGSVDELDRLMNELDPVNFERRPAAMP
jgi:hypothetical protein